MYEAGSYCIVNQLFLSCTSRSVGQLAALAQSLITFGSPSAQPIHPNNLSSRSNLSKIFYLLFSSQSHLVWPMCLISYSSSFVHDAQRAQTSSLDPKVDTSKIYAILVHGVSCFTMSAPKERTAVPFINSPPKRVYKRHNCCANRWVLTECLGGGTFDCQLPSPEGSEYEGSAINCVRCFSNNKDNYKLY